MTPTPYADRLWLALQSERDARGILPPNRLPMEVTKLVMQTVIEQIVGEAVASYTVKSGLIPPSSAVNKARNPRKQDMTDEEWVKSLEEDEALRGVDVKREIAKCQLWYRNNISKAGAPTRRRILNWLMKAERAMELRSRGATHVGGVLKLPEQQGPADWLNWLQREISILPDDHPAQGQLLAALNCRKFSMLPNSWRIRCESESRSA